MDQLNVVRLRLGEAEHQGIETGLARKLVEVELLAAAVTALERFDAPEDVVAYKRAELEVGLRGLMVEALGYHAMVDVDPLLLDNEGPIGPSVEDVVVEYQRALEAFARLELNKEELLFPASR